MEVSFRDLTYVKATIRDFISKKSLDLVLMIINGIRVWGSLHCEIEKKLYIVEKNWYSVESTEKFFKF